jgi:hypothetical protein
MTRVSFTATVGDIQTAELCLYLVSGPQTLTQDAGLCRARR